MKILSFLLLFTIPFFFNYDIEDKPEIDLELLSEQFSGDYYKAQTISMSKKDKAYFVIPNVQNKVGKVFKLQSFDNLEKFAFEKMQREFIYFEDAFAVNGSEGAYLFKISDATIDERLLQQFDSEKIINLFGLSKIEILIDFADINFELSNVENSYIISWFNNEFPTDGKEDTKALTECACNEYTTACTCTGPQTSCSTTCSGDAYACCALNWNGPSCECLPKEGEQE